MQGLYRLMARSVCLLALLQPLGRYLYAVEDERRAPKELPTPKPQPKPELPEPDPKIKGDTKILVKSLDGIRLLSDSKDVKSGDVILLGVEIVGLPLLDNANFRQQLKPFLGQPVSLDSIRKLAQTIILYFREQGRPFIDVSIPEQDITGGVVQLLIKEASIGEVKVEGSKYWKEQLYRDAIRVKPGDRIEENVLIEDLNHFNSNAFRQIKPIFKPGKESGKTDLTLKAEERFPLRLYTGYEDSGTQETGLDRLVAGFNWGNAFFMDQEIGYGYSTDIDFERLQSHSGYWRIPLPNHHRLTFTGGYSEFHPDLPGNAQNPGVTWQAGTRYQIPLPRCGEYRHEVTLGFEFKQTNTNLDVGGTEVFASSIDIAELVTQYAGSHPDRWGQTSFTWSGFFSPGHLTSKNTSHEYAIARIGSDPQYAYGKLEFERVWKLPKEVTLVNRFVGQLSTARLQNTEQLLLGGYQSVRGYDDRLVPSDEGAQVNVELRSPNFMVGRIKGDPRFENRLQFITFYDFGFARNKEQYAIEPKETYLDSVGGGVRWRMGTHVDVHFDYGRQLRALKGGLAQGDHGRIHLGVLVSF